jgi:uncharacterized membrane protein YidH (DUF202 family)
VSGPGGGGAPVEVFDEGMQAERTSLAWERTALGLAANAALLARAAGEGVPVARIVAFVVLGLAGIGFVLARSRYVRRDASLRGQTSGPGHGPLLLVGAVVVALSVTILVVVVVLALA